MTTPSTMAGADVDRIASEHVNRVAAAADGWFQGRGDLGIPFDTAQT